MDMELRHERLPCARLSCELATPSIRSPHLLTQVFPMAWSLFQSLVRAGVSVAKPTRRRRKAGASATRDRDARVGLETLEQRMALTVAAPAIGLTAASDTGIRGDGITRVARPVFAGVAPAKSSVIVYADGHLLGVTTATAKGLWSLATPASKPLAAGDHVLTAYAVGAGRVQSAPTLMWMAVDPTPPTASLAYDPNFSATPGGRVTGRVTLTFSEPVLGVSLAKMQFTDLGLKVTVGLGSPLLKSYVGTITTTQLSDRSYAFTPSVQAFAPGSYAVTLNKAGIVDRAGNPLATDVSTRFTIA